MQNRKATLIIKNASQLVTLHDPNKIGPKGGKRQSELNIIKNGAVAVSGKRIIAIGETNKLLRSVKRSSRCKIVDAGKRVVTPGLVDPHTHPVNAGDRSGEFEMRVAGKSYLEIAKAGGGINATVKAVRKASKKQLIENGRKVMDRMLAFGTTTAEAKSGYGLTTKDEIKMLEAIRELDKEHLIDFVPTFLGAHEIPPEYKKKPDEYVKIVCNDMIPKVAKKKLALFCDVFCEKGVFTPKQTRIILQNAQAYGLRLKLHADEFFNTGGAELAAEFGAISADHLCSVGDEGIHLMHKTGVIPVLLPGTSFYLKLEHHAPARKMIRKGMAVALATDCNPGSSMTESMQMIMTLACQYFGMSTAEVLTASTLNSAYAIGKENEIGSLAPGKYADILIWDVDNYQGIPYHFGVNMVSKLIKKGKEIF